MVRGLPRGVLLPDRTLRGVLPPDRKPPVPSRSAEIFFSLTHEPREDNEPEDGRFSVSKIISFSASPDAIWSALCSCASISLTAGRVGGRRLSSPVGARACTFGIITMASTQPAATVKRRGINRIRVDTQGAQLSPRLRSSTHRRFVQASHTPSGL